MAVAVTVTTTVIIAMSEHYDLCRFLRTVGSPGSCNRVRSSLNSKRHSGSGTGVLAISQSESPWPFNTKFRAYFWKREPATLSTPKLQTLTANPEPSSHSAQPQTRPEANDTPAKSRPPAEASAGSEEKIGKVSHGMSQACADTAASVYGCVGLRVSWKRIRGDGGLQA